MILKIFSPKKIAKKWRFLTQNKAKLCKILIITSVFEENASFFAENWQKSQKIVIITSTPDSATFAHRAIAWTHFGRVQKQPIFVPSFTHSTGYISVLTKMGWTT
jgi:hypothetical protein